MKLSEQGDIMPDLWWPLPEVLAGMSMPFIHPERPETLGAALHDFPDELPALWRAGVRGVVCLLNMPSTAEMWTSAGFHFHLMPVANGGAPSQEQFQQFLTFMAEQRVLGHPVAVHCEAGIGRTGAVLGGYLVAGGLSPEEAITRIRLLRSGSIETEEQLRFVRESRPMEDVEL